MDSDKLNSGTDAPELPLGGPGARLRAAREGLRLELAHVAAETRIPLRHLEAIEADNFESLPSRAYAIGFSRTFAKAVGLDAGEITDAVRVELADGSMQRNAPLATMEPGDPARLPSRGLAWASIAAVVTAHPAIVEVHRMAGEVDYLLKVLVPDMEAYDAFYLDLTRHLNCRNVTSKFSMERIKATSVLPVDTTTP